MQLGYTLVYVADVAATVDFYERAFGLARRFVHDSGSYAEMETGATALAFAAETLAGTHGLLIRHNRRGEPAAAKGGRRHQHQRQPSHHDIPLLVALAFKGRRALAQV